MIRFDNVSLRYDDRDAEILRDISFMLPAGAFYFLTGPSGAGKSSLLRLMYLGIRPTTGHITLFDKRVDTLRRRELPAIRRRMGVVFQDFRLLPHLSALENVALPLRVASAQASQANAQARDGENAVSAAEAAQEESDLNTHVAELLRWVGLGDHIHTRPPYLSGGQQQRIAIARAVINRPRLLLADEPTGNVDDESGLRLMHLFVELNKLGTTVIIASHNRALMDRLGKPQLHLDHGRLAVR